MPLPNLLRKASSFILGDIEQKEYLSPQMCWQDGEVLYGKNNVCVHPPTPFRQHCDVIHNPGYMTLTCKVNKATNASTLHLTWIPNSTLRKHPATLENAGSKKTEEGLRESDCEASPKHPEDKGIDVCLEAKESVNCGDCEKICSGGSLRNKVLVRQEANGDSRGFRIGPNGVYRVDERSRTESSEESNDVFREEKRNETSESDVRSFDDDGVSLQSRSLSLTSTCSLSFSVSGDEIPTWMRSPELLALQHNLTFPESATASPITFRRAHRCRRFSVDLSQMRSLRLFFADPEGTSGESTSGQLVVASRESQYKILHFHHGGLDKLASTLHQWHQFLHPGFDAQTEETLPYRHFMVCRPEVSRDELHPEEGQVPMVTSMIWKDLLNEKGQVEDDLVLRKGVFFGGLEPALRKIVWPFLLHCYSYQSNYEDREQISAIRMHEYEEIENLRKGMGPEDAERFWKQVVCIVEKDVVRTDRANPYYAGENNPNIEVMKNILLNYAVYNPRLGYTQGMSDLLAPLLAELNDEHEAFWCFTGLMQRSVAVCTPTDTDMDRNLCYLRELLRIMVPDFYEHLERHEDALELLFCHRWILLCLKREFPTEMALAMWEACWVNYLTDHFHLFLCLAIICVYANDVIAQNLKTDEMLLYFSSLAMYMDGNVVLRKARGMLYNFRLIDRLPCTLSGLCRQCGPGMWDSSHDPVIECIGHDDEKCPNNEIYH